MAFHLTHFVYGAKGRAASQRGRRAGSLSNGALGANLSTGRAKPYRGGAGRRSASFRSPESSALGAMNVDYLYRQLGLSNPEVLIKAKEYQRLLALRLPGGLGQVRRRGKDARGSDVTDSEHAGRA